MQTRTSRLISIRKLVAWDIKLHGSPFILLEFGLGAPAMLIFGFWLTTINFSFLIGLYIFLIGINYFVLLSYAISIARKNSIQSDIGDELPNQKQYVRRYGSQQFLLLVPLAVLVVVSYQELKRYLDPTSKILKST